MLVLSRYTDGCCIPRIRNSYVGGKGYCVTLCADRGRRVRAGIVKQIMALGTLT